MDVDTREALERIELRLASIQKSTAKESSDSGCLGCLVVVLLVIIASQLGSILAALGELAPAG